jgi:hypothetical protein
MTTPTGQISLGNVRDEFGASVQFSSRVSLGNYRVKQFIAGREWGLDDGVQRNGGLRNPISLGELRGKTLNIVVDYSGETEYDVNSETRYNSSGVVVGGFISRPNSSSSDTKKVHHVIRKKIGGNSTIASITPTQSNPINFGGFAFFINLNANTLGPFLVSRTEIPYTEWPQVCTWRGCTRTAPTLGVYSTTTTNSPILSLSGGGGSGATISMTKTRTNLIKRTSAGGRSSFYRYWDEIYDTYTATLISGGARYNVNDTVTTSWDGRTFNFTVSSISSGGPSFRTGSGWNGLVQLNYYIESGAVIGGRGGDGGNGGQNSDPGKNGENGGNAFGVSVPCTIYLRGDIRNGAGGGGGGSFQYQDIGRGCGQRYNGDGGGGGAGIPAGKGGREQNFAPGAYDGGCSGDYRFAYNGGDGTELTGGLANTVYMLREANRAGNGGSLSPYSPTGGGGGGGTSGGSPGFAFIVAPGGSYTLVSQGGRLLGNTTYSSF